MRKNDALPRAVRAASHPDRGSKQAGREAARFTPHGHCEHWDHSRRGRCDLARHLEHQRPFLVTDRAHRQAGLADQFHPGQLRLGLETEKPVTPTYADLVTRHLSDIGVHERRLAFTV